MTFVTIGVAVGSLAANAVVGKQSQIAAKRTQAQGVAQQAAAQSGLIAQQAEADKQVINAKAQADANALALAQITAQLQAKAQQAAAAPASTGLSTQQIAIYGGATVLGVAAIYMLSNRPAPSRRR
jgi:hypothetical protein